MTQEELNSLLAEVEADLSLRKSLPIDDEAAAAEMQAAAGEEEQAADMGAEAMAGDPAADEAQAEAAAADMGASDEIPAEEAGFEGEQPQEEGAPEEEPSIEEIYAAMDEEELQHHFAAIQSAMQGMWKKELDAKAEAAPVKKDEMLSTEANGKLPMMKSEDTETTQRLTKAVQDQKAYTAELEAGLADLVKSLEKAVPARKSITDIAVVQKSEADDFGETLEKSEPQIFEEASKIVRRQDLTKSERNVLNAYFLDRSQVGPVRELLKAKK